MSALAGREIVLGVTGGIAAYKAVEVLRGLKKAGAEVSVVMTQAATQFVAPLTFQTLSNRPVGLHLHDLDTESKIGHVHLADRADLVLVAPCTANSAAKLRGGLADDLLSNVLLATRAPVFLALAMNDGMYTHAATQDNLAVLQARGVQLIAPETGFLAEGREAVGRLAEPASIVARIEAHFAGSAAPGSTATPEAPTMDLAALRGRKVLVTAGPTVEPIDPVRYLTNRSSGRMGYAIAEVARDAGAEVILVSGPTALPPPPGVTLVRVQTAEEMRTAVLGQRAAMDVLVLAAAVADYRVRSPQAQKIKRAGKETLVLELEANRDIAAEVGAAKRPGQVLVVFAAESEALEANARKKLASKHADLVVANDITEQGSGFDGDQNHVLLVGGLNGNAPPGPHSAPVNADTAPVRELPLLPKRSVALHIWGEVARLLSAHGAG